MEIPADFGLPEDVEGELSGDDSYIEIRRCKPRMSDLVEALRKIGPPPDGVQKRDPIEFPERPGL